MREDNILPYDIFIGLRFIVVFAFARFRFFVGFLATDLVFCTEMFVRGRYDIYTKNFRSIS